MSLFIHIFQIYHAMRVSSILRSVWGGLWVGAGRGVSGLPGAAVHSYSGRLLRVPRQRVVSHFRLGEGPDWPPAGARPTQALLGTAGVGPPLDGPVRRSHPAGHTTRSHTVRSS